MLEISFRRFCLRSLIFSFWLYNPGSLASELNLDAIGVLGLSHHFDNNEGNGYEEFNYGIALHFDAATIQGVDINYQFGLFRNSYDDLAGWVGVDAEYQVLTGLRMGFDVRHWETVRNTYRPRLISVYPTISAEIKENIWFHTLLRTSGPIFSLKIDLD